MEFSRKKYWSGLPFHSPGDLPNPGIKPQSPTLQADALPSEPPGKPSEYKGEPISLPFNIGNKEMTLVSCLGGKKRNVVALSPMLSKGRM